MEDPAAEELAEDVMAELLAARRYAAIEVVAPYLPDLVRADRAAVRGLCRFAGRVLELDAEDFATLDGVPPELLAMVRGAHMPGHPRAADRGALGSLVPTYRLFLEVLSARWERDELSNVLAVLHLIVEYLPLLAWQSVLGHAGDPVRLARTVAVPGSRWGTEDRACGHPPGLRRTLRRTLTVADQEDQQWERYLDRDHSRVSGALGQCASHPHRGRPDPDRLCRTPCTLWTGLPAGVAADLARRMTLAGLLLSSPVLALRHAAPVGHGFGVPSRAELLAEWQLTWQSLTTPWGNGTNPLSVGAGEGAAAAAEPLPGLTLLLSTVAAVPLRPLGVLDEVDLLLAARLGIPPGRVDTVGG